MKKLRISIWIWGLLSVSTLLHAQLQLSYTEYSVHVGGVMVADAVQPYFIAAGPDGALWFTEDVFDFPGKNCVIGRITTSGAVTEYPILTANTDVTGITAGPDGALWYSIAILDRSGGKIGRITTGGVITEYPLPIPGSWPSGITTGPDGALWFGLQILGGGNMIGRFTTAGVFTGYQLPDADGFPAFITTGPDGALWFTLVDGPGDNIGRITTAGALTVYPVNASPSGLAGRITAGPDGALWFTEPHDGGNFIGRITTAGVVTQYPIPAQANDITVGPDGALWFTFVNFGGDNPLGRITTTGTVTTYPLHTLQSAALWSIVTGPDGALWAADNGGWIGRAAISPAPTPTISQPSPPLGVPGGGYFSALSASGGTPPYSHWTVSSGSLPQGFSLDAATGAIDGLSMSAGIFNFGVTVEDSAGVTSAEQIISITIGSPANLAFNSVRSIPHILAGENWTTTFTLINKGAVQGPVRLDLWGDQDSGTLPLPLIFPQQPGGNPLLTISVERNVAANASLIVQTAGPQTGPVKVGWAQVGPSGAFDGFAIFHHVLTGQETVAPFETLGASSYLLAFDNTAGNVLGIALANPLPASEYISVIINDDSGMFLELDTLSVPAYGHLSFVLPLVYPVTSNRRGTISFSLTPRGGQIGVLGMRFAAPNNALTTIPGLTDVQRGGGSVAHIATGNGWKTTFVLVNFNQVGGVGQPSPFQLNFFADNGSPLALPVGYPQTASDTSAVTSSVQQTLAPGATLIIESAAPLSDPAPTIGSAQLSSNGLVKGFVIFRYEPNGQEAAVPFETRTAGGYLLAFDNTAGTATGLAVNSVSAQAVDVPVVIRNDAGIKLATDTLHLAANGHSAFTLAADKYPMTANIRGTIEFDKPQGAQIGALAFRIPASHTFTTLPALTVPGTCVPTVLGCL